MFISQVTNKEEAEKAVISVGQEIIRRAKDICNDINMVTAINIKATIIPFPDAYQTMEVTKEYTTNFEEEKKENEQSGTLEHRTIPRISEEQRKKKK